MSEKMTLVLGASENTERYSNRAIRLLQRHQVPVLALGLREGNVNGTRIQKGRPAFTGVHTVTIYLGKQNQEGWSDYLLTLKPQRVIFNPGAENDELKNILSENGIETMEACTLVMLNIGAF